MGVSWGLECVKCAKVRDLLFELEHDEEAEVIENEFGLGVEEKINVEDLVKWLRKHEKHGDIIFQGYP